MLVPNNAQTSHLKLFLKVKNDSREVVDHKFGIEIISLINLTPHINLTPFDGSHHAVISS